MADILQWHQDNWVESSDDDGYSREVKPHPSTVSSETVHLKTQMHQLKCRNQDLENKLSESRNLLNTVLSRVKRAETEAKKADKMFLLHVDANCARAKADVDSLLKDLQRGMQDLVLRESRVAQEGLRSLIDNMESETDHGFKNISTPELLETNKQTILERERFTAKKIAEKLISKNRTSARTMSLERMSSNVENRCLSGQKVRNNRTVSQKFENGVFYFF